jgi:hypothetical protein
MGNLLALNVRDGSIAWQKNFVDDFAATIPSWGATGAPLVDGERLITLVGGEPDAKVIAFDKRTGAELWRALSSDWEPGYAQPIVVEAGGARQLMIWHPTAISSLDPATGRVYWEVPFQIDLGITVPTLVHSGPYLFATTFYNGARMLKLDEHRPAATLLWRGDSFAPHSIISTPIIQGDYIYGMNSRSHDAICHCVLRAERRSLLHQHRTRRSGHRPAEPGGLSRDQPYPSDRADASVCARTARYGPLVASGVRQPARDRPQRQRDPASFARQRLTS